ncbi:MAG TPA: DUF1579 domain-containing protein [Ignavibacteria bacterium]|nr:DUF1579 domain-containing protein [Ignavibacteria bacterium]
MKLFSKILLGVLIFTSFSKIYSQTEAEQKAWMEYMTPGPVHEMLSKSDGEWKADISMWMDPTSAPMKTEGVCINKMILGGRYQYSTNTATMMGMPFEGILILGYDNVKKEFVSSWIDNMGTGIMNMTGKWDESTKSANFTGTQVDPVTGKDIKVREVFKILNDNTQSMEMFMEKEGSEMKSMEIMYFRK